MAVRVPKLIGELGMDGLFLLGLIAYWMHVGHGRVLLLLHLFVLAIGLDLGS